MRTIVGVIDDFREGSLDDAVWPAEYFPIYRTSDHSFGVVARTRGDAGALLLEMVKTLHH